MARSLIGVKDLNHFIAVYRLRGFLRAASALRTTQSNVSMRIALLERQLGVQLFERRYRTLVPTVAGKKLYRSAVPLVRKLEALERTARTWRKRGRSSRLKKAA